jgi:predicted DNA-binding transcriptional regulator AlpA
VTVDEPAASTTVELIQRAMNTAVGVNPKNKGRRQGSRHASCGQKASLLKVCENTVWRMQINGEMPKPIRIGRAISWGNEQGMGRCWLSKSLSMKGAVSVCLGLASCQKFRRSALSANCSPFRCEYLLVVFRLSWPRI